MPGTQRKSPPKVQPKKVAPEAVTEPAHVERFNLADVLAVGSEPPLPVTFFGVDAEIRRAHSGEDAAKFFDLAGEKNYGEMLALLTDKGPELWGKIGKLNTTHAAAVLNEIFEISGLYEGKLLAPMPAFSQGVAGARPTPDSSTTTG